MSEKPFYFSNGNYRLFGVYHQPDETDLKKGFVFCYPFEEEKLWVQRVYVNLARELCRLGYHILRFDFMGEGDSEGDFEDSDISSRLTDMSVAIQELRRLAPQITELNLFGMRFGATMAAVYADRNQEINNLVLWDPIINGGEYLNEELRKNLTTQVAVHRKIVANRETLIERLRQGKTVNIDGYDLSRSLYEQAEQINLLEGPNKFNGGVLVIQIERKKQDIKPSFIKLKKLYKNLEVKICSEHPFWKEIKFYYPKADSLFSETIQWLKERGA